ncbi:tyrosine--tRNA ligase [Patescibacteria group bacterium]|nr:tyrosine--tRNA ligase [Patescibacteria group bacterium]
MKRKNKSQKIKELLTRGVDEIINKQHLEKRLKSGGKLRVKFGIDPTGSELHLGHSVPFRKLRQFQDLGHKVIFLIGDFTAKIGDPSRRMERRKPLSEKQIKNNMKDYVKQTSKVLDIKKVEIRYNSEWYKKKKADFLMDLTSRFTYARVIERDDFKRRIKKDIDVSILELIYPLLQGYDSVELEADVEIGGRDQKFNLLMGRKVQKRYGQSQQDIITVSLLEGTDGIRKMSKSYRNYIGLTEPPEKMYGKIMSIPDSIIWKYFNLLTDISLKEIKDMREKVDVRLLSFKDLKAKLAKEVVSFYHSKKAALAAAKEFERVFKEKKLPSKIPEIRIKGKKINILDLLVKTKLASSKSGAKRLILQKGVKINSKVQKDWKAIIEIKKGLIVQVGKRRFAKIN